VAGPKLTPPAKPTLALKKKARFGYGVGFQTRILRILWQEPDFAISVGSHVDPSYFDKYTHRWLAQEILSYASENGHGISKDILRLKAARAYKSGRMRESEHGEEIERYIKRLSKDVPDKTAIREEVYLFVKHQAIKNGIFECVDHLEAGDFESVDEALKKIIEVKMAAAGGMGHFFFDKTAKEERLARRLVYEKNGIATGIRADDYMKPGGLPPKNLGCVLAPPNAGKTSTLIHMGRSAIVESGAKVLHITLEISAEQTQDRYDAAFANIALNDLERVPKRLARKTEELLAKYGSNLVIKEFSPGSQTVDDLRNYVRMLERFSFYPDVILVDYADLLVPSRAMGSSYDEMGLIYRDLRRMAIELLCAVWTASQTNRGAVGKKVVTITDLGDSFKKAHEADVILALCQTDEEKIAKMARFFLAKNRIGRNEIEFPVRLDWARQRVINL
jgi:replicative DNA helicase